MKAKRNITPVSRPGNLNPNVWNVMKKVANEIWSAYDRGASWNRQVLVSCKEFYEMLLDENGKLILDNRELVRFAHNGHIKSWANELLLDSFNLLNHQEYELAIKKLELHLSINPDSSLAWAKLADANLALGKFKEALSQIKTAIDYDNKQSAHFVLRAKIYSHLDRDEKALNDLNFALLLNNRDADALAMRGSIYLSKNENRLAISDLKKALSLNPAKVKNAHLLAKAYLSLKRYPEAFKVLKLVLKNNAFDAEALFQMAVIRLKFKVEEHKAEDELLLARSLGHPKAEQFLLDYFAPLGQLGIQTAA